MTERKDPVQTFENDVSEHDDYEYDNPEYDNSEDDNSEDDNYENDNPEDDNSEIEDSHVETDVEAELLKSKFFFVMLTMDSWTMQLCFSLHACGEEIYITLWRRSRKISTSSVAVYKRFPAQLLKSHFFFVILALGSSTLQLFISPYSSAEEIHNIPWSFQEIATAFVVVYANVSLSQK